jgi:hypothetical protein
MLQRSVPNAVLARVFGALESLLVTTIGLGGILAPLLIDLLGLRGALIATGAVLPLVAAVFWRRLVAIDRAHARPLQELSLLRRVPIFAPLPEPTLEELASSLAPLSLPGGQTIFRQGDRGDRFYVISTGEVDVSVDGKQAVTLRSGDYFGEIALLRDVPRTADVTTRGRVELYALERDRFIAAVTGHAPSRAASDAVISARLGAFGPRAVYD